MKMSIFPKAINTLYVLITAIKIPMYAEQKKKDTDL